MAHIYCDRDDVFQSAPPIEVRGDISASLIIRWSSVFQSAPPIEVRGDPPPPG